MICVTICNVSYERAVTYARKYPFVEFRLETLPVSVEQAKNLFSIARRSIATCRPVAGEEKRREIMLKTAAGYGADFVDVGIDAKENILNGICAELLQREGKLILSYHNFDETPADESLKEIIGNAFKYGADIVKIACTVHSRKDTFRLMSLCGQDSPIIAVGMGKEGRLSRILAPISGSLFTFACPDEEPPAAPGQLPYSRMKQLQKALLELIRDNA